ncbi:hypothetical protein KUTeg_007675, partial [Tegillarca granosa]
MQDNYYWLFKAIGSSRDMLVSNDKKVDFWLTIEAFEYLHDDPCLPVDPAGSGNDQLLAKTVKSLCLHRYSTPLKRQLFPDCFFHSSANRSVVAVGYNLGSFTDLIVSRHEARAFGYYFEMDYGVQHQRVSSLMYTQLYDPYNVVGLADKGWVKVQPSNSNHS